MLVPVEEARPNQHDRLKLVGKGDRLLGLVLRHTPARHQWAQWLRLPLASAAYDGDAASVEELLAAGADGKAGPRGSDGSTLVSAELEREITMTRRAEGMGGGGGMLVYLRGKLIQVMRSEVGQEAPTVLHRKFSQCSSHLKAKLRHVPSLAK